MTVSLPQLSKGHVLSCTDSTEAVLCDVLVHVFNVLRGIDNLEQAVHMLS